MPGLDLSVPAHTGPIWDFLCGLERLEGLDELREKETWLTESVDPGGSAYYTLSH